MESVLFENDRSYFNTLGIVIFDEALEAQIIKETALIRLDSINSMGTYPDDLKSFSQKRTVGNHCLEFYKSKILDNLTQKQKKNWRKAPSIIDKTHTKIPTY